MTRHDPAEAGPEQVGTRADGSAGAGVQLDLLDLPAVGRVRHDDPVTSVEAARGCRAPQQQLALLRALAGVHDPLTGDDLADMTEIRVDIVRTRLSGMRTKGLAVVDGRGPARCSAPVWPRSTRRPSPDGHGVAVPTTCLPARLERRPFGVGAPFAPALGFLSIAY